MPHCLRLIFLAILLHSASFPAIAATGDTFSPFASAAIVHDSNLLRLDNSATNTSTADRMRQVVAGMNMDWKVSRQHFLMMAAMNDNRFDRYNVLNYQGRDLQVRWNWQLGNHLSGDLGYTNNLMIGSFADQRRLISNQRTQARNFFDGRWLFHPSWQLSMGVSKYKLTYSDINQLTLNREDDAWETAITYLNSTTSKIAVNLREFNGSYPNQAINFVTMIDNGYRQREVFATLDWNYSAHSLLHGEAGTIQRKHDHFASRDFSGMNVRGTYIWSPIIKVRLDTSAWRKISAYDDLTSSYSLNRGISLKPSWSPTSKITVSGELQYEQRNFLGDPGILGFTINRKDASIMRKLAVSYQPGHNYSFNLSVSGDKRSSNRPLLDFDSKITSFNATFQM